jgi:hypothetical protein
MQIGPKPSLTSADAAKSDSGAFSWQRVLTRRPASALLTGNALTGEWAQLGSNQRPLACKDCHHHSPGLRLIPSAQGQNRAGASTAEHHRAAASRVRSHLRSHFMIIGALGGEALEER